jgi:inner membrane protease subunit 1
MLPTFANWGDVIMEDRITYALFPEKLARGDVILVESPLERGHKICKRVLGLPGETVCVDPTGRYAPSDEHVIIPKGHIWVVGDNASMSRDSRLYGPVPLALIKARVLARVSDRARLVLFN